MGHVAEHIALELQTLAGTEARHGKTRSTGTHGQYNVIYEYREEHVGLEAGKIAVALVNHLVAPDDPSTAGFDFADRARAAHPARRAAGLRPLDAGAHRRGGASATCPGSASTATASSSSARASTSSASGPR